jgi:predicted DNA-binding transcriptional regulator YafY
VFRLDRILAVAPVEASFTPPPGFDPVEHVRRTLATVPYTHEVEVLLDTTLDEARRRIPSTSIALSAAEGRVRLRTRVERLDGTAALLAGLGWRFTVVRPDGLRAEVRALARRLAEWSDG